MPCDTLTSVSLDIGKVDGDAFQKTLESLGFRGTLERFTGTFEGVSFSASLDRQSGQVTLDGRNVAYLRADRLTAALKQGHSRQIVLRQAKRTGWQVKETPQGKMILTRRS